MFTHVMRNIATLLTCLWLTSVAEGASSGNVGICNAKYSLFGCEQWAKDEHGNDNRMECIDERGGIMPWASAPVPHPAYTLRSGDGDVKDDVTHYVPGEYVTITLRVVQPGMKFRGLLLHAVDASGTVVGSWGLDSARRNPHFWHPDTCGEQYVLHTNAELKNFKSEFKFKGPVAGTGTITFHALIKRGPANEGWFYYPVKDLVLQEYTKNTQEQVVPSTKWYIGDVGDDCHATCKKYSLFCNTRKLQQASHNGLKDMEAFEKSLSAAFPCSSPLVRDCSVGTPAVLTVDTRGSRYQCYYHDFSCSDRNATWDDPAVGLPTCGAYSNVARRFCACGPKEENFAASYWQGSNAANSTDPSISLTITLIGAALVLLLGNGTKGRSQQQSSTARTTQKIGKTQKCKGTQHRTLANIGNSSHPLLCLVCLICIMTAPTCEAHNWIMSAARGGSNSASTGPCPAYTPGTWSYQVGPDQDFYVHGSTGHGSAIWLVMVKFEDMHHLEGNNYIGALKEYLNEAPSGSNKAREIPRLHLPARNADYTGKRNGKGQLLYKRKIKEGDSDWGFFPGRGAKPDEQNKDALLFQWNDEFTVDHPRVPDMRVSYDSEKYPWIKELHRYRIAWHQPIDANVVRMRMPKRLDFGHYVILFQWRGYRRCIDVEYRTQVMPYPNGIRKNMRVDPVSWVKIDHCEFTDAKHILTGCQAVQSTAEPCTLPIEDKYSKRKASRRAYRELRVMGYTMGVNVVSIRNPNGTVPFKKPNIPWNDQKCLAGDVLTPLSGTITRSDQNTNIQFTKKRATNCKWQRPLCNNQDCTILDALREASGAIGTYWVFTAIAAQVLDEDMENLRTVKRRWWGCRENYVEHTSGGNAQFSIFIPPARPTSTLSGQPEHIISFQHFNSTQTGATLYDTGKVYQSQQGKTFGWNCEIPGEDFTENSDVGATHGDGNYGTHISSTYIKNLYMSCPGTSTPKEWNFQLPEGKGYYLVKSYHNRGGGIRARGCLLEHERLTASQENSAIACHSRRCDIFVRRMHIFDDKFTLSIEDGECDVVNWISIKKIGEFAPPVMYPSSSDPWWQQELNAPTKITSVKVKPTQADGYGSQYSCSARWLFEGDYCDIHAFGNDRGEWPGGTFNSGGFTVSLADAPCDPVSKTCPSPIHVCGTVKKPAKGYECGPAYDPIAVDCGGVEAKFVRIQLHGERRIFQAEKVEIFSTDVMADSKTDLLCYGLQTRDASLLYPEYTITEDPEDPAFYSTCYLRDAPLKWEPREGTIADTAGDHKFGDKCMTCDSVTGNAKLGGGPQNPLIPRWVPSNTCVDCSTSSSLDFADPDILRPEPPPPGTPIGEDGNSTKPKTKSEEEKKKEDEVEQHQTGTILVAIFVPLGVLLGLAFLAHKFHFEEKWRLMRRRRRMELRKKEKKQKQQQQKYHKLEANKGNDSGSESESDSSSSESESEDGPPPHPFKDAE